MKHAGRNYLRTHRKRHGLTQREVGFLVGLDSGQVISRYEVQSLVPQLHTALAYQIIFDEALDKLFPDIHEELEASIATRLMQLIEVLGEQDPTPLNAHKQGALRTVLERIETGNSNV